MRFARLGLTVAVVLSLAACASGPKMAEVKSSIPAVAAEQGRVYFYRSASMMGAALQPKIQLNGTPVGESVPGGFFFIDQTPGNISVTTATEVEKALTFTLTGGQTRYVRTTVGFGLMVGRVYPELVDNETAEKELADLSYTGKPLK